MGRPKTTNEQLAENSRKIVAVLKEADAPINSNKLVELTGLNKSKISAAIKYQRRWFLDHPARTEYNYIISTKRGYKMPQSDEEYIAFFQTLYSWSKSVRGTISAVEKYLEANGHDINQIKFNAGDGGTLELEMGGKDSWHDERIPLGDGEFIEY